MLASLCSSSTYNADRIGESQCPSHRKNDYAQRMTPARAETTKGMRLKAARQAARLASAKDGALAARVKYATYAGHENGNRSFSYAQAERYAAAFGVDPMWLFTGKGEGPKPLGPVSVPEPHDGEYGLAPLQDITIELREGEIPILGTVAAGAWLEVDGTSDDYIEREYIPVPPDPRHPIKASYGLVVSGTSINKIATAGDVLVCLSTISTGLEVEHGDLVIVERVRQQEGLREVTAKRVRRYADRIELAPESTDPRWQEPIILWYNQQGDHEDVRIIARVQWIYRPVRRG